MDLKDLNLEKEVIEIIEDFGGYTDTNALCNIMIDGRKVQVSLSLIDQDESDFNDYDGVPTALIAALNKEVGS